MKLNWGHYLAIAMTLFIAFIVGMVTLVRGDKDDLTDEEYYEKGLQHESQIQLERNSLAFIDQVSINYEKGSKQLLVDLPDSIEVENIRIELMRPDDANLDEKMRFDQIENETSGVQNILRFERELKRGFWKSKIFWRMDTTEYYANKDLFVQ